MNRALQGGSWNASPKDLHAANRDWAQPDNRYYVVGFRVMKKLKGAHRVLRGGSWSLSGRALRAANRDRIQPDLRFNFVGFRVLKRIQNES